MNTKAAKKAKASGQTREDPIGQGPDFVAQAANPAGVGVGASPQVAP